MQPVPRLFTRHRRRLRVVGIVAAVLAVLASFAVAFSSTASAAPTLLSQGKPATASSTENAGTSPPRRRSTATPAPAGPAPSRDPQWIQVDLGATAAISQVILNWEAAYATRVPDPDVAATRPDLDQHLLHHHRRPAALQTLNVTGTGRYVRMNGTARATGYGYSLWEFQVYRRHRHHAAGCGTANAAQGRPATASSTENAGTPASARRSTATPAPAGRARSPIRSGSRSTSAAPSTICQVVLNWEAAYATAFQIQVSANAHRPWTNIYTTTTGTGGTQTLDRHRHRPLRADERHRPGHRLRLLALGVRRSMSADRPRPPRRPRPRPRPRPARPLPGGGALGPNVIVFDPCMSGATIQAQVDTIFTQMESNQFGTAALRAAVQAGHLQRLQRPDRLLHLDRRPRARTRATCRSTVTSPSTPAGSRATRPRTSGVRPRTSRSTPSAGFTAVGGLAGRAVPPDGRPR